MSCGPQLKQVQESELISSEIVANNSKVWENGHRLKVFFLNGTEEQKHRVKQLTLEWTKYGNISLDFVQEPPAEIRVSFKAKGNNSHLGTDALKVEDQSKHTLSLSALSSKKAKSDVTILHEFGHALGIEHEHLSPYSELNLDRQKIKNECFLRYGFKEDVCENAIFKELDETQVTAFDFDPHSVMGYDFHDSHYQAGSVKIMPVGGLSLGDKLGIAAVYPGKVAQSEILLAEAKHKNRVMKTEQCEIIKNVCARDAYTVQYTTIFGNLRKLGVCTKSFYEALSTMLRSSKC